MDTVPVFMFLIALAAGFAAGFMLGDANGSERVLRKLRDWPPSSKGNTRDE